MMTTDAATQQRASVVEHLTATKLIAIVRVTQETEKTDLPAVAQALVHGGIHAVEFTLNSPGALDAIGHARSRLRNETLVGAGTVRSEDEAMAAINAGAQFLISPITSPGVIAAGHAAGIPVLPGAYTPTEIAQGIALGAGLVKLFPAGNLGPAYVREVLAPLDAARLVPTGGVRVENVSDYLDAGAAALAVGAGVCRPEWVETHDYERIERAAQAFRDAVTAWEKERMS